MTGAASDLSLSTLDALSPIQDGVKAIQAVALTLSDNAERAALTYVANKLEDDIAELVASISAARAAQEGGEA